MLKAKHLAMAWLRKDDWPRWLELDPDFQPDYWHWLQRMLDLESKLKVAGVNVVRLEVEPDEVLAWARSKGQGVNTNTRAAYAAMKLAKSGLH